MNKWTGIGNLAKNPELKVTPGGVSVCTFTVAVQRKYKDQNGQRQADFIPVVTWRGLAENCGKYLSKGKKVAVSGAISIRSYEADDGTKRYVTEIVADDVEFLTPQSQSEQLNEKTTDQKDSGQYTQVDEDGLPF